MILCNRLWLLAATSVGLALVSGWLVSTAIAQTIGSSYTSIAEKKCRKFGVTRVDGHEIAGSRECPGVGGYKVFVSEDDLRENLTVGRTRAQAAREPAAQDHYGAFNFYDDTVEWRSGPDRKPFAIIVGWSYDDNEALDKDGRPTSRRLLVVMRLPPGPVCKVTYVDRAANPDANVLARKAADEVARNFKCATDKVQIFGNRGRAIEAMSPAPEPEKNR